MSCERYSRLIDDLVEGELEAEIAGRVDSHIFTCLKCREQFEVIKREKDVYAHYLFDAEPPSDLWANFQMRLNTEEKKTPRAGEIPANALARQPNIFSFWSFSPMAAGAALIIVFGIGFGWVKFAFDESEGNVDVAKTETNRLPPPPTSDDIAKSIIADSPVKIGGGEKNSAPHNDKLSGKDKSSKVKSVSAPDKKSPFVKSPRIGQKTTLADVVGKSAAIESQINEGARRQKLQMENLENEIAGQIEKVELLLRSFRNARASATSETFDVEYEKGQARQLLGKNVRLRRDAENYGIFYAEELLNRVEPYLLDIANLTDHPAPDKVLDIKERFKNQSIIASLQIY